jgi:hypothetical protein
MPDGTPADSRRKGIENEQLGLLLTNAAASVTDPSLGQLQSLPRLDTLRQRLVDDRFQLAVLGQFKRGTSTLLNAMLGTSVLPTAVVPLTAIPTFILEVHRRRMNELIELVRRTAANLMNVTFRTTEDTDAPEFRHEPYWILSGQPDGSHPNGSCRC